MDRPSPNHEFGRPMKPEPPKETSWLKGKLAKGVALLGLIGGAEQAGEHIVSASKLEAGAEAGLDAGKKIGFAEGEAHGKEVGLKKGINEGLSAGIEEGKQTAKNEIARANDPKTKEAEELAQKLESQKFRDNQDKISLELESLVVTNDEKKAGVSEHAAESNNEAHEKKVEDLLADLGSWLRTNNSKEIEKSEAVLLSMIKSPKSLEIVRKAVKSDKKVGEALRNLYAQVNILKGKIQDTYGNNLEGDSVIYQEDKDSLFDVSVDEDDNGRETYHIDVRKYNETTREDDVTVVPVSSTEYQRRSELYRAQFKEEIKYRQADINTMAEIFASNTPEAEAK